MSNAHAPASWWKQDELAFDVGIYISVKLQKYYSQITFVRNQYKDDFVAG